MRFEFFNFNLKSKFLISSTLGSLLTLFKMFHLYFATLLIAMRLGEVDEEYYLALSRVWKLSKLDSSWPCIELNYRGTRWGWIWKKVLKWLKNSQYRWSSCNKNMTCSRADNLKVVYEIVLDETVGGLVEQSVHLISHLYRYLP